MKKIIIAVFLLFLVLIVGCTSQTGSSNLEISLEKQCTVDEDCVAATCCHATDAVNKNYAPDCADVLCTLSCEPGTLDCNQGEIRCLNGACVAILEE